MSKIELVHGCILLHEKTPQTTNFLRSMIGFFQYFVAGSKYDNTVHASIFIKTDKTLIPAHFSKYEILEMDANGLALDRMQEYELVHVYRPINVQLLEKAAEIAINLLEKYHIGYSFIDCARSIFKPGSPPSEKLIKELETAWPKGERVMCSEFINLVYSLALDELKLDRTQYWNLPQKAPPAKLREFLDHHAQFYQYLGTLHVKCKKNSEKTLLVKLENSPTTTADITLDSTASLTR